MHHILDSAGTFFAKVCNKELERASSLVLPRKITFTRLLGLGGLLALARELQAGETGHRGQSEEANVATSVSKGEQWRSW